MLNSSRSINFRNRKGFSRIDRNVWIDFPSDTKFSGLQSGVRNITLPFVFFGIRHPAFPFLPVKVFGLIERGCASDKRDSVPMFISRPLNFSCAEAKQNATRPSSNSETLFIILVLV